MTNIHIAIVADDLTGAADTLMPFVQKGWSTYLRLDDLTPEKQLQEIPEVTEVVALSTNSRSLPAKEAQQKVGEVIATLKAAQVACLYKKVDSTLRGAFVAEIEATLDAWHPDAIAVVCPAFPNMGRTLVEGMLLVNGVPVHETAVAQDPVTPVTEGHLPTILNAPLLNIAHIQSVEVIARSIQSLYSRIVVVDATTNEELYRLAQAICLLGTQAIPVGSAGLAQQLTKVWGSSVKPDPVLVVVTSQHTVAQEQLQFLQASGARVFSPSESMLLNDWQWEMWQEQCLALMASNTQSTIVIKAPQTLGLDSDSVANSLGKLAAAFLHTYPFKGVVATGGDGAAAVLRALHATGIVLVDAVADGVPLGYLADGDLPGLPIVTKAGAFGDVSILQSAVSVIQERKKVK